MTYSSNYTSVVVSVTTEATVLAAADSSRSALILFNQGSSAARIYFDTTSTAYFELAAGTGIHFPEPPRNAVNAVTASGTAVVTVMEA